jgi:hypothetical protein
MFRAPLIALAVVMSVLAPAGASNVFAGDEIIVAVLDTGIHPSHQEFDYRGPSSTDDQIVAWWDFTDTHGPARNPNPGQVWDTRVSEPYDDHGHGTGTASLAVGLNQAPAAEKYPSFAPGFKLAVGRVCKAGLAFACGADRAKALEWAIETVGADIVSVSVGSSVPAPDAISDFHEIAKRAQEMGVLVVVSNGNGFASAGTGVMPGWSSFHGDSTAVLAVGGSGAEGAQGSWDPEVAAAFADVPLASNACDTCYGESTGTSFSAPIVAGMAAAAMQAAVDAGHRSDAAHIEQLLKFSARDTELPPTFEGYGVLDSEQLQLVLDHAASGTLPTRPTEDVNRLYVDEIGGELRRTWSGRMDRGLTNWILTPVPAITDPLVLGRGFAPGIAEVERFSVELEVGEELTVAVEAPYPFLDLQLYRSTGPDFQGEDLVINTKHGVPQFTYKAPIAGGYTLLVAGDLVITGDLEYSLTSTSSLAGAGAVAFDGQGTYLATGNTALD